MIIYRGVSTHQRPAPGWFYHPDIEFARQFTQSGQFNEILKAELQDDTVYYHDPLPYGGDPDEVDGIIELAKAAGKHAVACDEGGGYEPSILVLKSALAKRAMRLLGRCTEMGESTSLVEVRDVNESEQTCRAVDLDGTLANYDGWKGEHHIGEPVPKMLDNVKTWLEQGDRVVIFTARAKTDSAKAHITKWLLKHGLPKLEITNVKTPKMDFFYDDKAVGIAANTGQPSLNFVKMFESSEP